MREIRTLYPEAVILVALFSLSSPAQALYNRNMHDVDKPRLDDQIDGLGRFESIDPNWDVTCWQAVSASMLNNVGYGFTWDIYDWFYGKYKNTATPSHDSWRDAINDFIHTSGFTSPLGPHVAVSEDEPNDVRAEYVVHFSPIGLNVDATGYFTAGSQHIDHAIAYTGYSSDIGCGLVADPDADWEVLDTSVYVDWSWFEDLHDGSYKWKLAHTWDCGMKVSYDVQGMVYLVPEPASLLFLCLGSLLLRRREAR